MTVIEQLRLIFPEHVWKGRVKGRTMFEWFGALGGVVTIVRKNGTGYVVQYPDGRTEELPLQ